MNIKERVDKLREEMKKRGLDAYIIPSSDSHQSEYVAEHFKARQWISGFTGSAGTVVITLEEAGLWTDGRYFIQAEKQLDGSGIKLFKMAQPGVPTYEEWLSQTLKDGNTVGFDGKVISIATFENMEKKFQSKNIKLEHKYDLIELIWKDRPELPKEKLFDHLVKFCGKSRREKLEDVRNKMKEKNADNYLISSLDDIAWLFNLRGNDVPNNPVFISYALVTTDKAYIFLDKDKLEEKLINTLKDDNIEIKAYDDINSLLESLKESILLDSEKTNVSLYKAINPSVKVIKDLNVTTMLKAIKNSIELDNLKKCQVRDGLAMVKFMKWIKESVGKEIISEISASERLENLRREQEHFIGTSFDTIAGYKEHAAMMHYKATDESDYNLKAEGLFLIDSGGQYFDGTTDITRTIALGKLTEEEMKDFTLVLKGHIGLSSAIFLYGTTGSNLDVLARRPLWNEMIDYKCGTGHGVGFLLNVHEGPHRISQAPNNIKLEKGMIITNEPGIYREGKHGIRTENLLLVDEKGEGEFGKFMSFETISYCPIDLDAINTEMLTLEEKQWLNEYHFMVYEKLSPWLNEEEKQWLKIYTRAI